ncbi:MAG TPA: ribosomal protein S18-alanine N-acetyltransferase [Anaeromyxobacteraceae bacterium]|nr:ribosomal protein S18-alanine N-acetyltransferase [Anaeromyxobacteraceae bacterium]
MREADLPRVMEIERAAFSHPWSEELVRRELGHDFSTVLLATAGEGGPILGFAIVWLVHDELHVLNVATAPEARRLGVARAVLGKLEGQGRAQGARVSMLEVRRSNAPAIALYRSLGYREVGVRPRYYAEDGEDALVMDKEL